MAIQCSSLTNFTICNFQDEMVMRGMDVILPSLPSHLG